MNYFHFLRPTLLWFLVVPVIYIIGRLLLSYKQKRVQCVMPEIRPYLTSSSGGYKELVFRLLPGLGLAVGILALAGPVWEKYADEQEQRQSISLVVHLPADASTNEVTQMKVAIYHLLDSLKHERVSLSVQSGSTHLLIPYTNDYRLLRTYTEFLSPDIMPAGGDHLEEIAKVVIPPTDVSFHTVVYITPDMSVQKAEQWQALELPSDYKVVLTTDKSSAIASAAILYTGVKNEGASILLASLRQKADKERREAALRDSTLWKDQCYLLCIPATLLLLPLFLRYKKNIFFFIALLSLSSCTYTQRMWNEAEVNFYLLRGDTLQAINASDDSFRRGMLWSGRQEYGKAAREFAQDSTPDALYNRALSTYHSGYFLESLSLLKEVQAKQPQWVFLAEDIQVIEELISTLTVVQTRREDWSSEDRFDSFEKDTDEKLQGNETELRADKLMNLAPEEMNYRSGKTLKRSEVLFQQIENNPKEFIKRRLEYEYTHKE